MTDSAFLAARHDRLRHLYADRAPLPALADRAHRLGCAAARSEENYCDCVRLKALDFQQLVRLMRCVTMELTET
jgi:hypothetical protein